MGALNFKSPLVIIKVTIIVIGIFAIGFTLLSHYKSAWRRIELDRRWIKPHRLCGSFGGEGSGLELPGLEFKILWKDGTTCPDISMELYLVYILPICFVISVLNLVAMAFVDLGSGTLKFMDMVYHGASTILLLIGGAVYIVSAEQIQNLGFETKGQDFDFMTGMKITAGSLAVGLGILYGVATMAIFIGSSSGRK